MAPSTLQSLWPHVLILAGKQHGRVARWQLRFLGFSPEAIRWLYESGRLTIVARGVYALDPASRGRPGEWMTAVLACGPGAVVCHGTAGAVWGVAEERLELVEVSVPLGRNLQQPGVRLHRRARLADAERVVRRHVPVTDVVATLIDLASYLPEWGLANSLRRADAEELVRLDELRIELDRRPQRPGIRVLRDFLDEHSLQLGDSQLERMLLPLARAAGLPEPQLGATVNGHRVDFFWPELGLVVETDGLRYHRTPAQQARDRMRDNAHVAAGLTPLRFTHAQIAKRPSYVTAALAATARRVLGEKVEGSLGS